MLVLTRKPTERIRVTVDRPGTFDVVLVESSGAKSRIGFAEPDGDASPPQYVGIRRLELGPKEGGDA